MLRDKAILYTRNRENYAYENLEVVQRVGTATRTAQTQGGETVEYLVHFFQLENGSTISADEIDYEVGGWMSYEDFEKIVEDHEKSLKWVLYVAKRLDVDKDYKIGGRKPVWLK